MKRILLPIITLLLIGLILISCDLFGGSDDSSDSSKKLLFIDGKVTPINYVFTEGESDIKDHLTVRSYYSDGTVENLNKEDYSVSPTTITSITNFVTVTYKDKTDDVYINISGSLGTLMSIEVLSLPKRLNYKENSNFDVSGLEVVGVYSDNTVKMINDYTLSFGDGTNVGTVDSGNDKKTIKNIVSYEGKETSFDINVRKLYTIKNYWVNNFLSTDKRNITKVIFDYTDNLPSKIIKKFSTSTSIGNTNNDLIYLIKDGTEYYIFSDGLIYENDSDEYVVFNDYTSLTEISFNNYDTSNLKNMMNMFMDCKELTSITFGDNFDTSNVTDMFGMFSNCSQLTSLDLSSFDTSNVEHMEFMFLNCEKLTSLNLSSFDTSKVTNMSMMFKDCNELTSVKINPSIQKNKTNFGSVLSGFTLSGDTYTKTP